MLVIQICGTSNLLSINGDQETLPDSEPIDNANVCIWILLRMGKWKHLSFFLLTVKYHILHKCNARIIKVQHIHVIIFTCTQKILFFSCALLMTCICCKSNEWPWHLLNAGFLIKIAGPIIVFIHV